MPAPYPMLLEPIEVGGVEIRNRVFFPPHSTHYGDRLENERHTAYYVERARGGVGLIVHEPIVVHPSSVSRRGKIWGWEEANIPAFLRTTTAVHDEGAKIFCQLIHNGRQMSSFESGLPLWAPSGIRSPGLAETPHEMTEDEISEVVSGFGRAAAICQAGGFDGVEIHGAHGYLVQAFLSPASNHRTDGYGGSEQHRLRFLREVVAAVRNEVGPDFAVGLRISGDELQPDGLSAADMQRLAGTIETDGGLDYLSVAVGNYGSYERVVPDMSHPWGVNVPLAAGIKRSVQRMPVFVTGRIADPAHVEEILAAGDADMVGLARAQIADPHWVNKVAGGQAERIRPCTYANECRSAIDGLRAVACMVNPEAGREGRSSPLDEDREPARIVVIGGGPAGMELAVTAARMGHGVQLVEEADELGGQLRRAAVESRIDMLRISDHLVAEMSRLEVELRLGHRATPDWVRAQDADVVVVATGARPRELPSGSTAVMRAWDVLGGAPVDASRVLVFDDADNGWAFCSTVEMLAVAGKTVIAATSAPTLGTGIDRASLPPLLRKLFALGVRLETLQAFDGFDEDGAVLRHRYTGERVVHAVDEVVLELGTEARAELVGPLRDAAPRVLVVGDASAPRRVIDAIREGHQSALSLNLREVPVSTMEDR